MTTDEMQRFLDLAVENGVDELNAARQLWRVLGIRYDRERGQKKQEQEKEEQ